MDLYRTPVHINNTKDFEFQSIEWDDEDYTPPDTPTPCYTDKTNYTIRIFGVDKEGNSVGIVVNGFPPHFYIGVPQYWKENECKLFVNEIKSKIGNYYKGSITGGNIVKRKKLYGFTNGTFYNFIRIKFTSVRAMKRCKKLLDTQFSIPSIPNSEEHYSVYEDDIYPTLRFMHFQEIRPGGWIKLKAHKYTVNKAHSNFYTQIDLSVHWNCVFPSEEDTIAPLIQCSFDIETYSPTHVVPNPDEKGHIVFQVATTFQRYNQEPFLKHLLNIGKCGPIEGCVVDECKNESELILKWGKLIRDVDPDTITGYNIFKYDINFMMVRADELGILDEFCYLGRVINKKTFIREQTLSSAAYGTNQYKLADMYGRLIIDMYDRIKKEFKFETYTLNFVANHFLGEHKDPVTPKMIFEAWESKDPSKLNVIGKYCVQDTNLPQKLMDKLSIIPNMTEMAKVMWTPMSYIVMRGQQIRVYSQIAREARLHKYIISRREKCIEFKGLFKNPLKCMNCGLKRSEHSKDPYKGATVLSPTKGFHVEPITVLDFKALYPTIMIDHNLDYSTLVVEFEYDNLPDVNYEEISVEEEDEKGKPTGKIFKYRFAQNTVGLLPIILENLLNARDSVKEQMKNESDPFKKNLLDCKQLAIKVSCNSVYGFCGTRTGMLPCVPIASCTTTIGRGMILDSKHYVEKNYANCKAQTVYGDTDSVFLKFDTSHLSADVEKREYSMKTGMKCADELTKFLRAKITETTGRETTATDTSVRTHWTELEYEKVYHPLLLLSKKRYVGNLYGFNMNKISYRDAKGLVLKRRDNVPYLKEVYGNCIEVLMTEKGEKAVQHAIKYMRQGIEDLLSGKIPTEKLILSKSLRTDYKNENTPHIVLQKIMQQRDPNSAPTAGERISYIFKETKNKKAKQYEKVEDPTYANENGIKLDYLYYLEKQLQKPLTEVFKDLMPNCTGMFKEYIQDYKLKVEGQSKITKFFQKNS